MEFGLSIKNFIMEEMISDRSKGKGIIFTI